MPATFTYHGDPADGSGPVMVTEYGHQFVKGENTQLADLDKVQTAALAKKLRSDPRFVVSETADAKESDYGKAQGK